MTTHLIDFATLSMQDALDLATLIVDEARERYEEFSLQMTAHDTLAAAGFFLFMAKNEAKHGEVLRERRLKLFGDTPARVSRAQLFGVEAPDYDDARAFMTARQALEVALRAEQRAFTFFDEALRAVHGEVRALFQELRDEELEHIDLVRRELAQLPEHEDRGEAFVDDPVGQ